MKVLFLHLSDLHISSKAEIHMSKISSIVSSLNPLDEFVTCFLIISGDIAATGNYNEYKFANKFISSLIAEMQKNFPKLTNLVKLFVPGNHDVNFNRGKDMGRQAIEELQADCTMDSFVQSELRKQCEFYRFAKEHMCFLDNSSPLICTRTFNINGKFIETRLINSAIFSTLDRDEGLHYLPAKDIERLRAPSKADFVIAIMHHAPSYFSEEQKNKLEDAIYSNCDILFLGHEHYQVGKSIKLIGSEQRALILANGALGHPGNETKSEYYSVILDTGTHKYSLLGFNWNEENRFYEHNILKQQSITVKSKITPAFSVSPEFLADIKNDNKNSICDDLSNYFVFPRLQEEQTKENKAGNAEHVEMDTFLNVIEDKKRVIIAGNDDSGKSVLMKQLFLSLLDQKTVLIVSADDLRGKTPEKMIKNMFMEIYAGTESDYKRFEQLPKSKKALIIDDANRVKEADFNRLLAFVGDLFSYIILGTKDGLELNLIERVKQLMDDDQVFYKYKILPFYADKRRELVQKVVDIKVNETSHRIEIVNNMCEQLKSQRLLANYSPNFIIIFVSYYLKNLNELSQNDGEIFSKVFETNLIMSLKPHLKRLTIDKAMIVIDKIAYHIHAEKAYPLKRSELEYIISKYNEEYDAEVVPSQFITSLLCSKIIDENDNQVDCTYRFCNKNFLAYFVARELLRKYNEEHDDSMLRKVLQLSCFGINADIILFISFLTNDANILLFILEQAEQLIKDWEAFNIEKKNIPFLFGSYDYELNCPTQSTKENAEKSEASAEKKEVEVINTIDIYDYNDEEAEQELNQMLRAISLLSVISKTLPAFEHMLKSQRKKQFVAAIYEIPNRIFFRWAKQIDNHLPELVEEIIAADYSRSDAITDEKAITLIRWVSTSVLLDLYNIAGRNASRPTTIKQLREYSYMDDECSYVQQIIMLEYAKKYQSFVEECANLYDVTQNFFTKVMVHRVVQHTIIHAPTLAQPLEQKLQQKYFSPGNQRKLLILKSKNERQGS